MNKTRLLIFLACAGIFSAVSCSTIPTPTGIGDQLGLSPYWDWKTIETEHFRLTFPKELSDIAMKAANDLEEANSILSPALRWQPSEKAPILVIDNADEANGLTTPLLDFGILLYVTPPDNWFSTAYYDDWLRLLCFHEYTHYLNMDTTTDFWSVLRVLTGDVALPNALWPPWMLEGLAVYMETRYTREGRGRSPFYDMIGRAAVEKGVLDSPEFVTLDKINGYNPYFPAGETIYYFGYQLMNEVASDNPQGQDALGIMSKRSGGRFPYFINNNLKNITGKDWYGYWDDWVKKARARAKSELQRIHSQPVTHLDLLTVSGSETLAPAPSPDGKWVAYTRDSPDKRMGLYLLDTRTRRSKWLDDKLNGATMAFTPDSKALVYSAVHRRSEYYLWSDLAVYDLKSEKTTWLTDSLRARDPDISRDGKWVVFTVAKKATTGIAIAPFREKGGAYELGKAEVLYVPPEFDSASTPKFSRDGNKIIFSIHHNGQASEDLVELARESRILTTLVSDGNFNRFPAVSQNGELYFVSNATGVDNVFRYVQGAKPEMVTNVTTGLAFPAFGPHGLYADAFTFRGWNLAQISLSDGPIATKSVQLTPPPAPKLDALSSQKPPELHYPIKDYSIFPSIWPRQWAPLVFVFPNGVYLGGEVLGFDAVDRHRYLLGAAYNTQISQLDAFAEYQNRSLGPTFALALSDQTTAYTFNGSSLAGFTRTAELSASASYPILWTYSSLTPAFSMNLQNASGYGLNTAGGYSYMGSTLLVPSLDALLTYSDAEVSPLAISAEAGRVSQLGSRVYFDEGGSEVWKTLALDEEFLRVTQHSVLVPELKGSWVSHTSLDYAPADVVVQGRFPQIVNSFAANDFDQLTIRGYPLQTFYAKAAAVGSLDYRFPLLHIFRGWGTNPFFLDNLMGVTFAEASYFPYQEPGTSLLTSAGGGAQLTVDLFNNVPLTFAIEFQKGFQTSAGGANDLFFEVGFAGINL